MTNDSSCQTVKKDWRYGEPFCPIFVPIRKIGTHEECEGCINFDGTAQCQFFNDLDFTWSKKFFGYTEGYRTIYLFPSENYKYYRVLTGKDKQSRQERLDVKNSPLGFKQKELNEVRDTLFNEEHKIFIYKQNYSSHAKEIKE